MVKKYTVKPVKVEAVQYDGSNFDEVQDFCKDAFIEDGILKIDLDYRHNALLHLNNPVGSYVVKHDDGTFDVIPKHEFENLYMESDDRHYAAIGSFY